MEDRELLLKKSPEFDRLAFTVLAIEAAAQKMGITPSEMRRRLDKVGLIKGLIQNCYDTLRQLVYHKPNFQICILSQEIVDNYLQFKSYERI